MANWCNNTVVFKGTPEAIEQITALFQKIMDMGWQIDFELLPDFIREAEENFFCYISYNKGGKIKYETRWTPNIAAVLRIARHYKVDFTLDYDEIGNCLYGRATYENGILANRYLDPHNFGRF